MRRVEKKTLQRVWNWIWRKQQDKGLKNCDSPAHNPLYALEDVSLPSATFKLCLFFHWDWFICSLSLFILASAHCSCNFLPLSCYQSNLKGFLLFLLFFHTIVLRVSVKITENQRGNKYFPLLSLSHCHCIFHFHFTYSVNKELCQALRLRGKVIAVASWSIESEERHAQNRNEMPNCYNIKYTSEI